MLVQRALKSRHESALSTARNRQLKSENGCAQKYRQTVRGIRGVSPEEEKEGYGWKDLQKRNVLSLE